MSETKTVTLKFRWESDKPGYVLLAGGWRIGFVVPGYDAPSSWLARSSFSNINKSFATEQEARTALETAVQAMGVVQADEIEADARRFRWLVENRTLTLPCFRVHPFRISLSWLSGHEENETIRDLIDADMQKDAER